MISLEWRRRAGWLGALLAAVGCQAVQSPTSSVVAQLGPSSSSAPWLESATLTYIQSPAIAPAPPSTAPPVDGVIQASHESAVSEGAAAAGGVVRVLAVRYPHPDGRRDYARAELVMADPSVPSPAANTWRARLGRFIDSATPGVEWGAGIRDARGLDVSIVELQMMLATAEKAANSGKAARLPDGVQAAVEVNGKTVAPSPSAALKLRILAMRVAREGKVISYPGSAADLLSAAAATNESGGISQPLQAANAAGDALVNPPALAATSP